MHDSSLCQSRRYLRRRLSKTPSAKLGATRRRKRAKPARSQIASCCLSSRNAKAHRILAAWEPIPPKHLIYATLNQETGLHSASAFLMALSLASCNNSISSLPKYQKYLLNFHFGFQTNSFCRNIAEMRTSNAIQMHTHHKSVCCSHNGCGLPAAASHL